MLLAVLRARKSHTHNPRGVSGDNREWGNVLGDDTTCSDDCPIADDYSPKDDGSGSYPHIHADLDAILGEGGSITNPFRQSHRNADFVYGMVQSSEDLHVTSNQAVVADNSVGLDQTPRPDRHMSTDHEAMRTPDQCTKAQAQVRTDFDVRPNLTLRKR